MNDVTVRVDDPNTLKEYGNTMKAHANNFLEQIAIIYKELGVLGESWTGLKSENFMGTLNGYKGNFEEFGENLINFGDLMIKTGDAYISWNK